MQNAHCNHRCVSDSGVLALEPICGSISVLHGFNGGSLGAALDGASDASMQHLTLQISSQLRPTRRIWMDRVVLLLQNKAEMYQSQEKDCCCRATWASRMMSRQNLFLQLVHVCLVWQYMEPIAAILSAAGSPGGACQDSFAIPESWMRELSHEHNARN